MSNRRFTNVAALDPEAVRYLPEYHPAMVENRTLFPTTVVEVTKDLPDRLLVSGKNNRKLGERVIKGQFAGYALYGLSLEERATCPLDCDIRGACYGSAMQFARRHKIGDADVFYGRLVDEICGLLVEHPDGLLIRLHVLGDFPSVDYVAFWSDVLSENPKVAIYGYTHRRPTVEKGDAIGDAIAALKGSYPDRFRIRWSSTERKPDSAVVIGYEPKHARVDQGLVCPAQTEATGCCATCALCWEPAFRHDTVVFVKHGPKSDEALAKALTTPAPPKPARVLPGLLAQPPGATRAIAAISLASKFRPSTLPADQKFEMRLVAPTALRVEPSYQRDLSGRSISLIRKIVTGWSWAKYNCPVCAETDEGLFIINGQHTAIAAATHPGIDEIPVMVIKADLVEHRADAFVAHNRDRLAMSALQIFIAEVTAGSEEARAVLEAVTRAGGKIPRSTPAKGQSKLGEVVAISAVRRIYSAHGAARVRRIVSIAVASGVSPISSTIVYGLAELLGHPRFAGAAALTNDNLAKALASITSIEIAAQREASRTGQNRYRACAILVAEAALGRPVEVAA